METHQAQRVMIVRGAHNDPRAQLGPFPGVLLGDVITYEFKLSERFETWPGRSRVERIFVLLDVGVSMSNPPWMRYHAEDGTVADRASEGEDAWYIDLVSVERTGSSFLVRDLYVDVLVPTDGRPYRMLDLDELGDAVGDGAITVDRAIDGLRRWQRFLDRYLHRNRWASSEWTDFPPAAISPLRGAHPLLPDPVELEA